MAFASGSGIAGGLGANRKKRQEIEEYNSRLNYSEIHDRAAAIAGFGRSIKRLNGFFCKEMATERRGRIFMAF